MKQMPVLEPRQLRMLCVSVPVLLLAAMSAYVVAPQLKTYRAATSAQLELVEGADSAALERELSARSAAIAEINRSLHGDMADVPVRELEALVVGRLQDIAWRHAVELVAVVPRQGELIEGFAELVFEVELAGRYTEVFAWLWDVRRELGFVVIKEFALERREQTTRDPILTARIKLASYRRAAQ